MIQCPRSFQLSSFEQQHLQLDLKPLKKMKNDGSFHLNFHTLQMTATYNLSLSVSLTK